MDAAHNQLDKEKEKEREIEKEKMKEKEKQQPKDAKKAPFDQARIGNLNMQQVRQILKDDEQSGKNQYPLVRKWIRAIFSTNQTTASTPVSPAPTRSWKVDIVVDLKQPKTNDSTLRVVCLSDTHSTQGNFEVPPGDILLHSGDLTKRGGLEEIAEVNKWFASLPHKFKVIIAGNHDFGFQRKPTEVRSICTALQWVEGGATVVADTEKGGAFYLQDSSVTIHGIHFYGSPWQPWFHDWAFNADRGEPIRSIWNKIPNTTDILITHGPPYYYGDVTKGKVNAGCLDLLEKDLEISPLAHVFGHIHESRGIQQYEPQNIYFINTAICTLSYQPENRPIIFDLVPV